MSGRLLTAISTQQLERAGVSIRVLGGRSTQDLDLEPERGLESPQTGRSVMDSKCWWVVSVWVGKQ